MLRFFGMDLAKHVAETAAMLQLLRAVRPAFRGGKASSLNVRKGNSLAHHGLNGKRAVARRLRQIEAGRLRVQNGLCEFGWVAQ